jgi:uncharacterized membrane protein
MSSKNILYFGIYTGVNLLAALIICLVCGLLHRIDYLQSLMSIVAVLNFLVIIFHLSRKNKMIFKGKVDPRYYHNSEMRKDMIYRNILALGFIIFDIILIIIFNFCI